MRPSSSLRPASIVLAVALVGVTSPAQVPDPAAPSRAPFAPGTRYRAEVPTLAQVLGHDFGEELSSHAQVEKYLQALAAAVPDRLRLVPYGTSWEGRTLYFALVGSAANLQRIEAIQRGMQRLADPRGLTEADATTLVDSLPAVGWLANCVHGDEPSGTDAALYVLYHLLAADGDALVDRVFGECVLGIDPLQNPDGRDRFVHSTRAARGRWPDATPLGAEHSQPWPGGRVNHALFDMNRDWFAMTQPETQARVRTFLTFWPLLYVDLHEMGGNSSYYFPPPAQPVNAEITPLQREWLVRYGRNNARWFDRYGFAYFTRESYDSFYPGYGEGWPTFHGSIGMTFEMASARGLVFRRRDEQLLHYRDGVQRHFTASMATLETFSSAPKEALRAFLAHRRAGVARGENGPVRAYVFPDTASPNVGDRTRLLRLLHLLQQQGVEVTRTEAAFTATTKVLGAPAATPAAAVTFPAGSYVVAMAQPASTLATVLLQPQFDMEPEFVARQQRREAKRRDLEFYDLTAWSLPLLFGVDAYAVGEALPATRVLTVDALTRTAAPLRATPPKVAYVVAWGENGAAALLAELLRLGVTARCLDEAFVLDGVTYPAGSYVIRVQGQPEGLHARLAELAMAHGVTPYCADSSWVERGPDLGSGESAALKCPRVAMAWDRPVSPNSAGWLRYLLEQRYGVPVSPLRTHDLARVDLDRFTVLILPEGDYGELLGKRSTEAIRGFVERGGVLITLGSASRWLMDKDVALLASEAEPRGKSPAPGAVDPKAGGTKPVDPQAGESKPGETKDGDPKAGATGEAPKEPAKFDYATAIRPDKEAPPSTPGAILRIAIDPEHWLGFGYRGSASVVHDSSAILTPVKLDRGTNVAIYAAAEDLVQAGFVWDESRRQLPQKAYLVHQPHGRGHVVAFAEDPNVRAFADGLNLLLLNAVLLTAGR